ncbi:MAG: hypothetical protein IT377_20415 [Polyangiaceae bacterium]|nr:hypothetical protein [Polyangiaceae bacterium]
MRTPRACWLVPLTALAAVVLDTPTTRADTPAGPAEQPGVAPGAGSLDSSTVPAVKLTSFQVGINPGCFWGWSATVRNGA